MAWTDEDLQAWKAAKERGYDEGVNLVVNLKTHREQVTLEVTFFDDGQVVFWIFDAVKGLQYTGIELSEPEAMRLASLIRTRGLSGPPPVGGGSP